MGTFFGYSQAEIIVTAPSNSGATTGLRAPNGTTAHTTLRGVMIIPASELINIPASTIITKVGVFDCYRWRTYSCRRKHSILSSEYC
jgi:hypothetical protein